MKRTQKIVIMSLSSFFSSVLLLEGIFMAFIITCMHCIHHHVDQIIYIEKIQENVTKRTILNACIPINFSKLVSYQTSFTAAYLSLMTSENHSPNNVLCVPKTASLKIGRQKIYINPKKI